MGGPRHDRRLPLIVSNLRDIVLAGFRHRGGPVRARLGFTLGLWPSFSSLFTGLRRRGILRSCVRLCSAGIMPVVERLAYL
jgi:hypothetical protein